MPADPPKPYKTPQTHLPAVVNALSEITKEAGYYIAKCIDVTDIVAAANAVRIACGHSLSKRVEENMKTHVAAILLGMFMLKLIIFVDDDAEAPDVRAENQNKIKVLPEALIVLGMMQALPNLGHSVGGHANTAANKRAFKNNHDIFKRKYPNFKAYHRIEIGLLYRRALKEAEVLRAQAASLAAGPSRTVEVGVGEGSSGNSGAPERDSTEPPRTPEPSSRHVSFNAGYPTPGPPMDDDDDSDTNSEAGAQDLPPLQPAFALQTPEAQRHRSLNNVNPYPTPSSAPRANAFAGPSRVSVGIDVAQLDEDAVVSPGFLERVMAPLSRYIPEMFAGSGEPTPSTWRSLFGKISNLLSTREERIRDLEAERDAALKELRQLEQETEVERTLNGEKDLAILELQELIAAKDQELRDEREEHERTKAGKTLFETQLKAYLDEDQRQLQARGARLREMGL